MKVLSGCRSVTPERGRRAPGGTGAKGQRNGRKRTAAARAAWVLDGKCSEPRFPIEKWGLALLPAPTAPSEGSAGVRNLVRLNPKIQTNPLSILAHQLRRRIPSNSSLGEEEPARSTKTARPEGSLVSRPTRPSFLKPKSLEAKTVRCSTALLGPTTLASPFAHRRSEGRQEPRRA